MCAPVLVSIEIAVDVVQQVLKMQTADFHPTLHDEVQPRILTKPAHSEIMS